MTVLKQKSCMLYQNGMFKSTLCKTEKYPKEDTMSIKNTCP